VVFSASVSARVRVTVGLYGGLLPMTTGTRIGCSEVRSVQGVRGAEEKT
jgi:hypothetical protein